MSRYRKRNKRKRRRDKRDKIKEYPVNIWETEKCNDSDELEEEILDLLRVPGAVMLFFDEKGEMKTKIKVET